MWTITNDTNEYSSSIISRRDVGFPTTPAPSLSTSSSSTSSANSVENSPESPYYRQQSRRSLRKHLVNAIASPIRVARSTLGSPISSPHDGTRPTKRNLKSAVSKRMGIKSRSFSSKTWQEDFDLPPNTTQDQAMAVLLCRELELMDL